MRKKKKQERYQLVMHFTKRQMVAIREEVALRMEAGKLNKKSSMVDQLCYTAAWMFHQTLRKIEGAKK